MKKFIHPAYFQVVRRADNAWYFSHGKVFYRGIDNIQSVENRESDYGLTKEQIVLALFRLNLGKEGFYLANLRDRKYYYCGINWEDVQTTLNSCGIGRADPLEK